MIFRGNHCLGHIGLNFSLSITEIQLSFLRIKNEQHLQYLRKSIKVTNGILSKGWQDKLEVKEVIF